MMQFRLRGGIMFDAEKKLVLDTALEIKKNQLVSLSGGNVSLKVGEGKYLVTPSGMIYERMTFEDVCLVDDEGKVIEGRRKPSSDTAALLYLFHALPGINAVIHTHQPWATAAGFVMDQIPEFLVTVIDACHNPVNVAPFTPSSALGMGELAAAYIGDSTAVILKHHGVITVGKDMDEALFAAVYLEESAKTLMIAKAARAEIPALDPELIAKEKAGWESYGQ